MPSASSVTYGQLADAILGEGIRPFANGTGAPGWRGMRANNWYRQSSFSMQHKDLAETLMSIGGNGTWVLEVGSFIGASASTWARATRRAHTDTTIIAMDTWLGDVGFWQKKGKWLGPPDQITGEPRIFEQFMANIVGNGLSDRVLPVRASSLVGLRYLHQQVLKSVLPSPHVIYLDSAHEYPETVLEMQAAWELLSPGGFLIGDDFDRFWPSVQQAVVEFTSQLGPHAFEPAASFAMNWPFRKKTRVMLPTLATGEPAIPAGIAPVLLKNSQWIVRKATRHSLESPAPVLSASSPLWPFSRRTSRCCHNRWTNDSFMTCRPPATFLQQSSCNVYKATYTKATGEEGPDGQFSQGGVGRCRLFACHTVRHSLQGGQK